MRDVIERRRSILEQMALLKPGEQIKLSFDKPLDVQNFRYKLYQSLAAIREEPGYSKGEFINLPNQFKLSWKRKNEPLYLYVTRRTSEEFKTLEIQEAKKTLHPYLQDSTNVRVIMTGIAFSGYVIVPSAIELKGEDFELLWEIHMNDYNAYGKREAVFIGTEEDGEGVDTDTWILKETD